MYTHTKYYSGNLGILRFFFFVYLDFGCSENIFFIVTLNIYIIVKLFLLVDSVAG